MLGNKQLGLIGIVSATMGRYREFDITFHSIETPPLTAIRVQWEIGIDLAHSYNNLCRKILKERSFEWLWILGDDHILSTDILTKLLDRNVDIVVPLCLKRSHPFRPVVYTLRGDKYYQIDFDALKGCSGLIEADATGNAGMLIRRNVIEKLGEDWHRVGWQFPEHGGSDLYFSKRVRENGFKIYLDLDNTIGHITHMSVWPNHEPNGEYSVGIRHAMDIP